MALLEKALLPTALSKVDVSQTLLGNPKGPVELCNTNISAEVKVCLFLFIPTQEVVCSETKVYNTISSG